MSFTDQAAIHTSSASPRHDSIDAHQPVHDPKDCVHATDLRANATITSNEEEQHLNEKAHNFPRFMDLPFELRELVWELCLPHRVLEMDGVFKARGRRFRYVCTGTSTSKTNYSWPVIAKVCHEARKVAIRHRSEETDTLFFHVKDPRPTSSDLMYIDIKRATPQLQHTPKDKAGRRIDGTMHLSMLLKYTAGENALAALAPDFFSYWPDWLHIDPSPNQTIASMLKARPSWLFVIQTFVIHTCKASVCESGLFGVLGDAPIQIVCYDDHDRFQQMYELAVRCEGDGPLRRL